MSILSNGLGMLFVNIYPKSLTSVLDRSSFLPNLTFKWGIMYVFVEEILSASPGVLELLLFPHSKYVHKPASVLLSVFSSFALG
jgi:hypothetical protein